MSKGSRQRPSDKKKFNEGWDRVFDKKGANAPKGWGNGRQHTDQ